MHFTIPLGQDANFEFGNLTKFTLHQVINRSLEEKNYFSFWLGWFYIMLRVGRMATVQEGTMKLYLCLLSKQNLLVQRNVGKPTTLEQGDWEDPSLLGKLGWLRQAIFLPHFNDGTFRIL